MTLCTSRLSCVERAAIRHAEEMFGPQWLANAIGWMADVVDGAREVIPEEDLLVEIAGHLADRRSDIGEVAYVALRGVLRLVVEATTEPGPADPGMFPGSSVRGVGLAPNQGESA